MKYCVILVWSLTKFADSLFDAKVYQIDLPHVHVHMVGCMAESELYLVMAASLQGRDLSTVRVPLGGDKVYKDECVYSFDSPVRYLAIAHKSFTFRNYHIV